MCENLACLFFSLEKFYINKFISHNCSDKLTKPLLMNKIKTKIKIGIFTRWLSNELNVLK